MANSDSPRGFETHGEVRRLNPYQSGGEIFPGDACKFDSDGEIVVVTAGDASMGVAASYASAQGVEVQVWDHPDQEFTGQVDDATVDAQTDINQNYDWLATGGNSTYKRSRMEVDGSTQNTTATLPIKSLGIYRSDDNALGAQVMMRFKINNHQLAGGTGTAGL